jgi:hypothetical protein
MLLIFKSRFIENMMKAYKNKYQEEVMSWKTMLFSLLLICGLAVSAMAQDYGTPDEHEPHQGLDERYEYESPEWQQDRDYQYTPPEGQEQQDQWGQQDQYAPPGDRPQDQQDPWGQQQQGMPNNFSDEEIEQVAHAYVDIIEIRDEYQEKLMEVDEPEAAQEIQMEANEKITAAVEARGIDVETYNNVITAAQGDETLMDELLQKIDEIQQQ